MKIGIIGLPNVGKSSLFNLLTTVNAKVAKFPFTTIDKNIGMVKISDMRLKRIVNITKSPKFTYASIKFVDIAGLIKGASKGEGLGNKFLSHIRDVDLIVHLLRCFRAPDIPHIDENLDPQRDYEIVRAELLLSDLEIAERRIEKIRKKAEYKEEVEKLIKIKDALSRGNRPEERVADLPLLSTKPELIVLNIDEDAKFQDGIDGYRLSVKLEEDIIDFSEKEKSELRSDRNLDSRGISGLIDDCRVKLSIILFYTIKGEEARAWTIKKGTRVIDAAGEIHSDLKDGFIKAEILPYNDFIKSNGFAQAQHLGLTKIEGRDYVVKDGDVILIKFRPPH